MVKHIIIWKFKEDLENKEQRAREIRAALEDLVGRIEGLREMHILTEHMPSSSGDVMMDSTFESEDALKMYQDSPLHQEVANGLVRPSMRERLSFDYKV